MSDQNEFVDQIKQWSLQARKDLQARKFSEVCSLMFLIRGTAQTVGNSQIAYIAGLGEEVIGYANSTSLPRNLRKIVGCVWDVLTTLDHLIAQGFDVASEEKDILIHRLEATLQSLKAMHTNLTQAEIDVVVRSRQAQRDRERMA